MLSLWCLSDAFSCVCGLVVGCLVLWSLLLFVCWLCLGFWTHGCFIVGCLPLGLVVDVSGDGLGRFVPGLSVVSLACCLLLFILYSCYDNNNALYLKCG